MADKIIKSPLKYQGSKLKLVEWIKDICKFDDSTQRWIEPFMGSGVVALNIGATNTVVNDINPHVINLFKMLNQNSYFVDCMEVTLRTHDERLRRQGADYFYEVRSNFNDNFHPNNLLFLNHACFNGVMRFNLKGKFNVPYGKKDDRFSESYRKLLYNKINDATRITKDWEFHTGDYRKMFDDVTKNDLIYLDPPYIDRESNYFGAWTDESERELHALVASTEARVVVSTWYQAAGADNSYVKSLWGDMNHYFKSHYYSVGQKSANRYPVVETLMTNF